MHCEKVIKTPSKKEKKATKKRGHNFALGKIEPSWVLAYIKQIFTVQRSKFRDIDYCRRHCRHQHPNRQT